MEGSIFVSESINKRALLLSFDLKHKRKFITMINGVLILVKHTYKLFVVYTEYQVLIFSIQLSVEHNIYAEFACVGFFMVLHLIWSNLNIN